MLKETKLFTFIALLGSLALSASNEKTKHVLAENIVKESFAYNDMIYFSSRIAGSDVTPEKSDNNKITSYGFYHGSVSNGSINRFNKSDVLPDCIGNNDETASFFQNWRMGVVKNDNLIIKFSAEKKMVFTCEREKIGNDFLVDTTLKIYKDSSLLYSKALTESNSPSDFYYQVVVEPTETIYWELSSVGDGIRYLQMDSKGVDWSTMPKFTIQEYADVVTSTLNFESAVENLTTSNGNEITSSDSLYKYQLLKGSIGNSSLSSFDSINSETDTLSDNGLSVSKTQYTLINSSFTYKISALQDTSLNVTYPIALANGNINLKGYLYSNSLGKTKLYYSSNDSDYASGNFVLKQGDILYLEFEGNGTSTSLPVLKSAELIGNFNDDTNFPKYQPTDYSNATSINYKDLVFESGRIGCDAIHLKDIDVSLLCGIVEEGSSDLSPFKNISYNDGLYVEGNVSPNVSLSNGNGFDGDNFAAVLDYRMKTSAANSVVFKFVANKNTALTLSHGATSSGWIDEAGLIYFGTYYSLKGKPHMVKKVYVTSATNQANAFGQTLSMQEGDVVYFTFATEVAYQRNLEIKFDISTNENAYDVEQRAETIGPILTNIPFYKLVQDAKANSCEPVSYDENIEVAFGYGNYKDPSPVIGGVNDDKDATDVLNGGSGGITDTRFFCWQIRAGDSGNDALIYFKAQKNIKLDITHPVIDNDSLWATYSSVKYYIRSAQGIYAFLSERYIQTDCGENFYGYSINLKEGETLIFDYSSNDEASTATFLFESIMVADETSFDLTKAFDFSNAIELNNLRNNLITALTNYVNQLNKNAYSLSNYAAIENYLNNFVQDSDKASVRQEVQDGFDAALALIKGVETIAQEKARVAVAKQNAILQASDALNSIKDELTTEAKDEATRLLNELILKINSLESENLINKALMSFKNELEELDRVEKKGCSGSVMVSSLLITSLSLIGCTLILKKKHG